METEKIKEIEKILSEENIDLKILKDKAWHGIPDKFRAITWKILFGYLPPNKNRRELTMKRKREEYTDCIPRYYDGDTEKSEQEQDMLRQILVDMPRTAPGIPLFHHEIIQKVYIFLFFLLLLNFYIVLYFIEYGKNVIYLVTKTSCYSLCTRI